MFEIFTSLWLLCFGTGPPQDLSEISRHKNFIFVYFVSKQIEMKDVNVFPNQSDYICVILQLDM